ncbi:hypothetical protein NDU88_006391 [Pleurodeles waltl]|uniref:Uncharacterized protein n=1 Tax=Pleurodeles waltl TaxID=8319 RepID=A0AAV7QNZ3_PLEWA|nr:hypothetical protein NDU88_006391 [Pleurodeles waltl]
MRKLPGAAAVARLAAAGGMPKVIWSRQGRRLEKEKERESRPETQQLQPEASGRKEVARDAEAGVSLAVSTWGGGLPNLYTVYIVLRPAGGT